VELRDMLLTYSCIYIVDGDAVLQSLAYLPDTFNALEMFVFRCLPALKTTQFVTYRYKDSIKHQERITRGFLHGIAEGLQNVFAE